MEDKKYSGIVKALRVVLVLCILVLFPLISFVFLWEGVTDRKTELDRMGDFGPLAAAEYVLSDSVVLSADSLLNTVLVVVSSGELSDLIKGRADSLLGQFGSTDDFVLLGLYDANTKGLWEDYANSREWNGSALLVAQKPGVLVPADGELPGLGCTSADCPYFLLVDRSGQVRRLIDPADREGMVSLVKQIAILIAKPRTFEKPQVVREREK